MLNTAKVAAVNVNIDSPVETHTLDDGQLTPARDRRLLLAGLCCKKVYPFLKGHYT